MHMGLSRDALSSSQKFIKVHSRWARWAAFGHKGQWFGGDEEPPSREAFLRVVAVQNSNSADSASAQKTQLGDAWDPTEGHARAVCDGFRSRGNDRRRSKVLPSHVRFLSADSVVEKASLKVLLHDGFDASVHQNIDNAVDSVAEFSPEVVMEHLQQDADSGSYTTATSHTLALQLNKGSLEEIKAGEAQQQQQHEARLQRRRGFSQAGDAIPGVPGNQDRLPTRVEVHHMSRVDADASVGKPVEVFSKGAGSWVEGYIVSVNTGKQTVQVSYKSATGLEMQKVLQLDSPDWRYPTAAGSVACPLSGVTPRTVSAERLGAQQQAVSAERLSAQQQAEDSRGGFVSALCSQTVIAEADKASLSCEMLIEASAAGEIYLGVAPITRTKSGMPPLEGSLYDRCPGWMAVRIADGGIWSGPGNTMAGEASQLLGDQRWMQAPAPRQEEAGGCTSWMQRWMQAGDGAGGHGGDWEPFAKVGDRIRLEILPHEKQAVVWKNDVEQGRLLLPQLTHAALEDRSLRWMVTMANEGDAASIAFNSEPPSAPERLAVPRPLDAGISYRRLVRNHIESHRCVSCEVIYEVLFMSSSSELKRLGTPIYTSIFPCAICKK